MFVDDEHLCGATLVHSDFVLTSLTCAREVAERAGEENYAVVMVGQDRRSGVGPGPWAQLRRLVSLKVVPGTGAVLGQLETAVRVGERVAPLCLPPSDLASRPSLGSCAVSGASPRRWSAVRETALISCPEGSAPGSVCTSGSDTTVDHEGWAGALACEDSTGRWVAAASYHITGGSLKAASLTEASVVASLRKVVEAGLALAPRATEDRCEGRRCLLGKCVGQDRLCDRVWDCVDGGGR